MKHPIWITLGILCAGASVASAQDQGGPLLSPVELELQNANTDDQLIKLARAAKINVMADVSDELGDSKIPGPATNTTLTIAKTQSLVEWLRDIAYTNRLSWGHNGGNTVVLWPKPNIVPLTRRIVGEAIARRSQIEAEIKPALHDKLDPELVARLDAEPAKWAQAIEQQGVGLYRIVVTDSLRALLTTKHGWDGQSQEFRLQLKDEQIPAELLAQIILYRRLIQARPNQSDPYAWLRDETWQKARLEVQQSGVWSNNGKIEPRQWVLTVVAPMDGKVATRSVATLTTATGGGQ